jgi:hypothetical protein
MSAPGRKKRTRIDGQFAAREIKMLESPAFRELGLSARRVLDRLEIELAHHGGMDNGQLPVTYDNFQRYGIDRHAIAPAIRELIALGFVEITEHGRAGNAQWRTPNRFRITYKPTKHAEPTHEWKRIATSERAKQKARQARQPKPTARRANKTPVGKQNQSSAGKPHLSPMRNLPTTSVADIPPPLSISRGGASGRASFGPVRLRLRPNKT